jgi:hypothetical protein
LFNQAHDAPIIAEWSDTECPASESD